MANRNAHAAALFIPLLILALHAYYFHPFFCDDAFISLRYADHFIHGKGLVWNEGERVEGYSNLLWILLVSLFSVTQLSLLNISYVIGAASAIAMFSAISWHGRKNSVSPRVIGIANTVLATSAPVAIWTIGGMESMLLAALLAWCYVLAIQLLDAPKTRYYRVLGLLLSCVALTRPEGLLFTALITTTIFLLSRQRKQQVKPLAIICATAASCGLAQVLFRLAYYGKPLPNTYYAKVAFTAHRLQTGLDYVLEGLLTFWPIALAVILCLYSTRHIPKRILLFSALIVLPWLTMVVLGGGDIFPGLRHFLPVIPLMALILATALSALQPRLLIASAVFIPLFLLTQDRSNENHRAFDVTYQWYGREVGLQLKKYYAAKKQTPLIAVTMAGAIPYYSGLPALDMLGLNDEFLTTYPNPELGQGIMGHELYNLDYFFARKPDIFIFGWQDKPWFGIDADPRFADYQRKKVKLHNQTGYVWVRKDYP